MLQAKINKENLYFIVACLLSIAIIFPIILIGIPDTYDLPQHYRFATTYYSSIMSGDFFPGWAGSENFGYGDIGIRFYPPLAYYTLAISRALVGNWYDATWLTFIFWMLLGTCGIFYWARSWFSIKESSTIAIIYIFIPFHLHQLYTGFNQFSEFAATSLLIFCFAFLTRIFQREKFSDVLGLGFFYGLLILAHLPTAIVGSICLLVYFLTFAGKDNFIKPFLYSSLSVITGLSISAFYWIKMIGEMKWLNHNSERFATDYFDYAGNFFPLSYFVTSKSFLTQFFVDLTIILTILSLILGIIFIIYKRKDNEDSSNSKSVYQTVLPVGLFAFFMFTPLSKPIWEIISPLQKIQFPVRWMPVAAMCGAIICGAVFNYLKKEGFLTKRICFYSFSGFFTFALLFNFVFIVHPASYVPLERGKFENIIKTLPEEESFNCWWTIWSKAEAFEINQKVVAENRQINIVEWKPEEKIFEVSEGTAESARIAIFYYPHWKATVNEKPVPIDQDSNGILLIPLSNEKSIVKISFQEPLINRIAELISISIGLLLIILLSFRTIKFQFFLFKDKYL